MVTGAELKAQTAPPVRRHWLEGERIRTYPWVMFGPFAVFIVIWMALSWPDLLDPVGKPLGGDFLAFWSGARLAIEGEPQTVYDRSALFIAHTEAIPGLYKFVFAWHYPPTYLLVVSPLGLLSYLPALGAFLAMTIAFWAALVCRMLTDRTARIAAAAFPVGLLNVFDGQNGFLTAGLAGFALLALEARPVAAGVLMGLLAIKPHLAVLFPLALIAARQWRTFAAAAVTAVGFTAIGIATFGWPTFAAFLRDLPLVRQLVESGDLPWGMMPSAYVFALSLGFPSIVALALQILAATAGAAGVWLAWRVPRVPFEAKAAILAIGSLLVSPYLFTYDLTWAGLGMAWLARLGLRDGFLPGERDLLFVACVVPLFMYPVCAVTGVQLGFPLLLALLGLCLARCGMLRWPRTASKLAPQ